MARIFISHSSQDDEPAARMKAWLTAQGFENAFLDKDKVTGIPPGAAWEKTLYREVEQSQAVVIIQTPNWLASKWCFAEFTQARALGKAIFPTIEAPTGDTLISPDIQTLNLLSDRAGGLERLKGELTRIALDAQGGFAWKASRPPFPGLLAFQEEDAAVYFGRDDDIRRLIERLEARRAQGGAKLIALLGSSGSGKSSLLRAGVIPRLKRAGRNWIVAPPLRPGKRPMIGLAQALANTCGRPEDWRKLCRCMLGPQRLRALDDLANDLRARPGAGEAQILIPIDQAEELFGVSRPAQARLLFKILSLLESEDLPFITVMALRSDFLGQLQSAALLTAHFEEFSLGPMPLARVPQIIEGPARVAGLNVEDAFVQQAARDAETEDALPLLSFALRQLLDRSATKSLMLDGYKALGDERAGITPLENAVRQAADAVLDDAKPTDDERIALGEAFVPAMVRVNEKAEYIRRPAQLDALPAKSHPLLERLAKARLLIVRQEGDERVIEVAHEALLRKWPWLKQRLDAARDFLIGKQQLEQDLRDWEAAPQADKSGALLTGLKLNRARRWLIEHPTGLTAQERAFILASSERADRAERTRRITTRVSVAAAVLALFVAIVALWERHTANVAQTAAVENESRALLSQQQASEDRKIAEANAKNALEAQETATKKEAEAREAEGKAIAAKKTAIENESRALAALSEAASSQDYYTEAVKLALAAWPRSVSDQRPQTFRTTDALGRALQGPSPLSSFLQHEKAVRMAAFSPNGLLVVTASGDGTARVWIAATGTQVGKPLAHAGPINQASFSPDSARVVTASDDGTAQVWDAVTGSSIGEPMRQIPGADSLVGPFGPDGERLTHRVTSASFSPDGERIVTASDDGTSRLWNATTGATIGNDMKHSDGVSSASFSPDGTRVLTTSYDRTAQIWSAATGRPIGGRMRHPGEVFYGSFSPDGAFVVTGCGDGKARLWNATSGAQIGKIMPHESRVAKVIFSPRGDRVVTASDDYTARLWDAKTGTPIGKPMRHEREVTDAAFSPNGALVATASVDGTARLWDAASGAPIGKPMRHRDSLNSAGFTPAEAITDRLSAANVEVRERNATTDEQSGELIVDESQRNAWVNTVAFSPNGAWVVTASNDWTARVWSTAGTLITNPMRHDAAVWKATFSPNGAQVATMSRDVVQLWDAVTGRAIGEPIRHDSTVEDAVFSGDGAQILVSSGQTAQLRDAISHASIGNGVRRAGRILATAFGTGGARVVTALDDKTARVRDAVTGAPIGEPLRHESWVAGAAFSSDGALVVTVSDKTAQVWDASTGAPIGKSMRSDSVFESVALSSTGAQVVTSSENTVQVWQVGSGRPVGKPIRHQAQVLSVAFSPDGARVLTASRDRTARVWDAATGAPISSPMDHKGAVFGAAFNLPDGTRIVTASEDRTARVWDAITGAQIGNSLEHGGPVYSALFSPDGVRVVTASADKAARLWSAPPLAPNIIATACKMLGDHNTDGLSTQYGIAVDAPICGPDTPAPDPSRMIDR